MDTKYYNTSTKEDHQYIDDDDDAPLPGFRFHPTDEELVDFYLRRKIEKKPISLELIKSIDIYKHDPWDLPKATSTAGDQEWYFFCRRGRKYKNSIRPNRVTGSGFWKATGIDKPIHSHGGEGHACIGLKKTLVYYRGSAGKGNKTDWMMHEFRLPNPATSNEYNNRISTTKNTDPQQEAEIWTLCRIFKRNVSYKKYTPDWRDLSATKRHPIDTVGSRKCTIDHQDHHLDDHDQSNTYISFGASDTICYEDKKPVVNQTNNFNGSNNNQQQLHAAVGQLSSMATPPAHPYMESFSHFSFQDLEDDLLNENWDELRSVVQRAFDPTYVM